LYRDAAQRGQHFGVAREIDRQVALATSPGGWNVGRVCFEHDRLQRQAARQLANPGGPFIRHRAAEAEPETERDEGLGLLPAAVEGMRDAAAYARPAQLTQDRIHGTPYMQDHRQSVPAGEPELCDKELQLARRIDIAHEVVEPD